MPHEKLGPDEDIRRWQATVTKPFLQPRPRIYSPLEKGSILSEINTLLSAQVIEESKAWITCNPHLVPKKNGQIRMVIDYRPINEALADFDWPLPRIQDIRHKIPTGSVYARYDLRNAFFHLHVPEEIRALTAFNTPFGKFQYTKMPFGLKTAPSYFQKYMDWLLLPFDNVVGYIDDILVFERNYKLLKQTTRKLRQRLAEEGVSVNMDKSIEYAKELDFVGIRFGPTGLKPTTLILDLDKFDIPITKTDRQSFLGFANYFRDFIPNFSTLAKPLYEDRQTKLHYKQAFQTILTCCGNWIRLSFYDDTKPAILYTDASNYGTGAVLCQGRHVIAICSKSLNSSQSKYSTTDRECLALVRAAESFRLFVQTNQKIIVKTDHRALLNRRITELSPLQSRWVTKLKWLLPSIEYEPGVSNPADYLSRKGGRGGWYGTIF